MWHKSTRKSEACQALMSHGLKHDKHVKVVKPARINYQTLHNTNLIDPTIIKVIKHGMLKICEPTLGHHCEVPLIDVGTCPGTYLIISHIKNSRWSCSASNGESNLKLYELAFQTLRISRM